KCFLFWSALSRCAMQKYKVKELMKSAPFFAFDYARDFMCLLADVYEGLCVGWEMVFDEDRQEWCMDGDTIPEMKCGFFAQLALQFEAHKQKSWCTSERGFVLDVSPTFADVAEDAADWVSGLTREQTNAGLFVLGGDRWRMLSESVLPGNDTLKRAILCHLLKVEYAEEQPHEWDDAVIDSTDWTKNK
ncbi:unnamed protein product, partial [Amoebophrya sp. A120]